MQTDTCKTWIPAFAGMTQGREMTQKRVISPLLTLERKNIVEILNKMKGLQNRTTNFSKKPRNCTP